MIPDMDYLALLKKKWFVVAVFVAVGALLGGVSVLAQTAQSTYTIEISLRDGLRDFPHLTAAAAVAKTPDLQKQALERSGVESPGTVAFIVTPVADTDQVDISAAAPSPDTSKRAAKALAALYLARVSSRSADKLAARKAKTQTLTSRVASIDAELPAVRQAIADAKARLKSLGAWRSSDTLAKTTRINALESAIITLQQRESGLRISKSDAMSQLTDARGDMNDLTDHLPYAYFKDRASAGRTVQDAVRRGIMGAVLGLILGVGFVATQEAVASRRTATPTPDTPRDK